MAYSNNHQEPIGLSNAPSSPTDTIEDDEGATSAFACIFPQNVEACRAFSAVAEAVLNREPRVAHHQQYMHIDECKTTLQSIARRIHMAGHKAEPENTETETETDTDYSCSVSTSKEPLAAGEMMWTGHYQLSLAKPPARPALGWRIGSGRWKIGTTGFERNGGIDLLLTDSPRQSGVRGSHASLVYDKESGILLLQARHPVPHGIKLDRESFGLQSRALNARCVSIQIGNLEYRYEYSLDPNSLEEAAFQRAKQDFFREHLNSSPPIEFTSATPSENDIVMGSWTLHRTIGRGTYGTVSAASHRTGKVAAFKYMIRYDRRSDRSVIAEVNVAEQLSSLLMEHDLQQRIIRRVEVIYQRGRAIFDSAGPEAVCIIYTPLARGTFGDLLPGQKFSHLNQEVRTTLFTHVLEGLSYLHAHKWVHRDIKPINIGIVSIEPPRATILDVGSAMCMASTAAGIPPRPGAYGTVSYLAPEMEAEKYDERVDIWALGVVAHEIFLGSHPWQLSVNPWRPDKNSQYVEYLKIHSATLQQLRTASGASALIAKMLAWEPEDRPSAMDALEHPYICERYIEERRPPADVKVGSKRARDSGGSLDQISK